MFNAPTLLLQERYYSFRVIDLLYIILLAFLKKGDFTSVQKIGKIKLHSKKHFFEHFLLVHILKVMYQQKL